MISRISLESPMEPLSRRCISADWGDYMNSNPSVNARLRIPGRSVQCKKTATIREKYQIRQKMDVWGHPNR
jgi:hypothetical protein